MSLSRSSQRSRVSLAAACLLLLSLLSTVQAHPYASGITNSAGTIRFILNENAGNVKILFNNQTVTSDLGTLSKGVNSFTLSPYTNYSIVVSNVGSGVLTQISS